MIVQTEGVVLRSFDLRETSKIVTFFTKKEGKISGVLKGIRKDPKKFGSSVDRFTVNDLVYYRYRNTDLHLVSQCDLKQYFYPLRQDLRKSLAASYMTELVGLVMPAEQKNMRIYTLILDFLNGLDERNDVDKLIHALQIKVLAFSGFKPHLDTCVKCQRQIEGRARFSTHDGGLVCPRCPVSGSPVHMISRGTVASLLHIEKNEWQQCLKLRLTPTVQKELKYLLNNFLVFHLGRKIRSAQYLG